MVQAHELDVPFPRALVVGDVDVHVRVGIGPLEPFHHAGDRDRMLVVVHRGRVHSEAHRENEGDGNRQRGQPAHIELSSGRRPSGQYCSRDIVHDAHLLSAAKIKRRYATCACSRSRPRVLERSRRAGAGGADVTATAGRRGAGRRRAVVALSPASSRALSPSRRARQWFARASRSCSCGRRKTRRVSRGS